MTTIEGNKLIAEFMHPEMLEVIAEHEKGNVKGIDVEGDMLAKMALFIKDYEHLRYHKSWNSLMPVVEKIENTDDEYDVRILGQDAEIVDYDGAVIIEMVSAPTKIQAVWELIIEFIQWYNEQKDIPSLIPFIITAERICDWNQLNFNDQNCYEEITEPFHVEAMSKSDALDIFHDKISIKVLDDFEIFIIRK